MPRHIALTLQQLHDLTVEMLNDGVGPETEVHISYNYGDHWDTQVAPSATELTLREIEYSDYHRMDKLKNRDEVDDTDDDSKKVIVLL